MCLIITKSKNVNLPEEKILNSAASTNKDGIGIALHKDNTNEILIKKDFFSVIHLSKYLKENVKKEDSLIIHFRVATAGLVDEGNRHPFPITKVKEDMRKTILTTDFAVAHNGVLSQYNKHEIFSDTQKFIMDILADEEIKNNLQSPVIQKLITNFIDGDKLAIMLNTGEIILLGSFFTDEELNYSNLGWKTSLFYGGNNDYGYRNAPKHVIGCGPRSWTKCDGCLDLEEDVRELRYKKVKLKLCLKCRRLLSGGTLDKMIEEKREEQTIGFKKNTTDTTKVTDLLSYCDSVKCSECETSVTKASAKLIQFGLYTCMQCYNKDANALCEGCDKEFPISDLIELENCLVCAKCNGELAGLNGSEPNKPKTPKPESETLAVPFVINDSEDIESMSVDRPDITNMN